MSSARCVFFVLVRVLVFAGVLGLRGVIVHVYRPFLVLVYRVSWSCLCQACGNRPVSVCTGFSWFWNIVAAFHVKRLTGSDSGLTACPD